MTSVARWIALAAIVLVAFALRTCELARRPMHADEANQAVKAGELISGQGYTFDPHEHHGPTLYYATLPIAWLRGQRTLASLSESTTRLVPALFGVLTVALLAFLGSTKDRSAALLAAAFLAASPPAVYYSRYYIQETLLVAFSVLAVIAGWRWWSKRTIRWAAVAGLAVGLMLATKESAAALVWLIVVAAWAGTRRLRPVGGDVRTPATAEKVVAQQRPVVRGIVVIAGVALLTAALFYSAFGRDPGGVWRAVAAPWFGFNRAVNGSTGHDKPWWYYLELLTWKQSGGLIIQQVLFTVLAAIGAAASFRRSKPNRWARAAGVYALLYLFVASLVPYKTPWNLLPVVPALAFLAAHGLVWIAGLRTGRMAAAAFGFLTFASMLSQSGLVAFRRSTDERNPYAYVHSSPDVLKYRALVDAAMAVNPGGVVRVISEEYWPLPWYLRGVPHVGYWTAVPETCDGALLIVSADLAPTVSTRLHGRYRQSYLGLRPGFVCVVFTPDARD